MTTDSFLDNIYSNSSGEPIISLVRINIDGEFEYYANNNEAITSDVSGSSEVYQPAAFSIALPEETTEGTPRATLDFDAADIQFVRKLRAAEQRIILDLWLVVADDPNIVEYGPANYESVSFSVSGTSVQVTLEAEPILDVQIPAIRYTPQTFPAGWRGQ